MSNYIDTSSLNPKNIDYSLYIPWSEEGDGISRICLRVDQGVNDPDSLFSAHYNAAKAAGIQQFVFYHFNYPMINTGWQGAQNEVNSFLQYLGNRLGPDDVVMEDAETYNGQGGPAAWYWDYVHLLSEDAHLGTARVAVYANESYIASNLQDERLAQFPLILAAWNNSSTPPAAPKPWASLMGWQRSGSGTVPGVPEAVDVDLFIHGPVPTPPPAPPNIPQAITDLDAIQQQLTAALQALKG